MTRTVDVLATEAHFAEHLLPIYEALPARLRGSFVMPMHLAPDAARLHVRRGNPTSDAVLVASYGDLKKARRSGYTQFARIEHGVGQWFVDDRHPSYAGGRDADDVGLFLVPNAYSGDRWQEAYPAAEVAVVGCPKIDRMPIYVPSEPPVVVFSFHWGGSHIPEAGSAFADFGRALVDLRRLSEFRVALHAHPRAAADLHAWANRHVIRFIPTFDEVLRVAAVYACDGVSTLYEFASTDRPVVVLNASTFRPHVNHGLRFWDEACVGVQVDHPWDLAEAIAEALRDRPAQRRRRQASVRRVYAYRGDAARRAAAAVSAWLQRPRQEVAA